MESAKKMLKERAGGLFLILFSALIITGVSLGSRQAESKNEQRVADENQVLDEGQILGEANDNAQEIIDNLEGRLEETKENDKSVDQEEQQEEKTEEEKDTINSENDYYDDLGERLKKYCGKKYDVKKCKKYLEEAKEARNKGNRFKDLYKKYHFEKKEAKGSGSSTISTDSQGIAIGLVIKASGSSKSYDAILSPNSNVIDLMKLTGVPYDVSSSGLIDNIDGAGKNSATMNWMLYLCKSGTCKMASVGPADCEIAGWEKIEWRYLDWTTMTDWSMW